MSGWSIFLIVLHMIERSKMNEKCMYTPWHDVMYRMLIYFNVSPKINIQQTYDFN